MVEVSDRAAALAPSIIGAGTDAAVIRFSSVSQVQSFELCARKWYYDKVGGVQQPTTARQAVGVDGHAQVEAYLKTGQTAILGRMARAGAHFLPPLSVANIHTEFPIHGDGVNLLTADGVVFRGFVDVLNIGPTWRDDDGCDRPLEKTPEIIDWKFLGDLKWAKTPTQLVESTQMIGYAEWARRNYHVDSVRVSHGSFQTQGAAAARKTSALITAETVKESWLHVEEKVGRMKVAARASRADDVEPTYSACGAYGGCHYLAICPRTPGAAVRQLFGIRREKGDEMSLLDKYRKRATEPTAEVKAEIAKLKAEEVAVKTPDVTPEQFEKLSETARVASLFPQDSSGIVKKELVAQANVTIVLDAAAAKKLEVPPGTAYETSVAHARVVGILPPDAPTSGPSKSAVAIPPGDLAGMHPAIVKVAEQFAVEGATVEVKPPPVGPGEGHTGGTIVVKKKPKKDKAPPTVAEKDAIGAALDLAATGKAIDDMVNIVKSEAVAPIVRIASAAALLEVSADIKIDTGITLQVDVITAGFTPVDLEAYVVLKCRALEREFGAVDIRCAPADGPLGFGKWKGALAALVRDEPPAPGVYLLNDVRGSEIREVVVEALRPLCSAYVRGR